MQKIFDIGDSGRGAVSGRGAGRDGLAFGPPSLFPATLGLEPSHLEITATCIFSSKQLPQQAAILESGAVGFFVQFWLSRATELSRSQR